MYGGRTDNIPGAIDAISELQEYFDLYILITTSWNNPSVLVNKVKWVIHTLGNTFKEHIII